MKTIIDNNLVSLGTSDNTALQKLQARRNKVQTTNRNITFKTGALKVNPFLDMAS